MPATMEADSRSLSRLNDDVVFEIFAFLSLTERKKARLVCRQWNRISNRRVFVQNEAFFISNMYQLCLVVEVLDKCQRKMLNLKFEQRLFGEDSNILWKKCGQRIQSLKFMSCKFPPDIIRTIFLRCINLNEFSACSEFSGRMGFLGNVPREHSTLQLLDENVVRPNLRTLQMDSWSLAMKERDLHLISSAFPQLTSLKIHVLLNDNVFGEDAPNLTTLFNLLDSKLTSVEELSLECPSYFFANPIDFTSVSQLNLDRLKLVSMTLSPFILRGGSFDQILSYTFWTSLCISWMPTRSFEDEVTIFTRLLTDCPLLEELDIVITLSSVSDFSKLFKALVKSRLKSLTVLSVDWSRRFTRKLISRATASFEELPCNGTVKYLSVDSDRSTEVASLFVKYFQNVRDLKLTCADVNTVFKYQKNLKSLIIGPNGVLLTDEEPVRRCIESLELLEIQWLRLDEFIQYQFPNLKYLVLAVSNQNRDKILPSQEELIALSDRNASEGNVIRQNSPKEEILSDSITFIQRTNILMLNIFRKSPHLEAIEFVCNYRLNAEAFSVFFQTCLHFHQLRYVSFFCRSPAIDEMELKREVEKYFKKCPSFRGFWFQANHFNVFFYFNIVTKKFEFSNEHAANYFSVNSYYCIHLHDFWRCKR